MWPSKMVIKWINKNIAEIELQYIKYLYHALLEANLA